MVKAVFYHREDSRYDDDPARFYHFPKMYLSRVQQTLGDFIVYYGPVPGLAGRYYSAVARVDRIEPDPRTDDHFYAFVTDFLNFDMDVPFRDGGGYERKLFKPDGTLNGGRAVQAVRLIEPDEFVRIVADGLSRDPSWPDRTDRDEAGEGSSEGTPSSFPGMGEAGQAAFAHDPYQPFERAIVERLVARPYRDMKFKQHVREAYDRRCAFTGLRLINGRGRPEVEAAHIKPVEKGGPDSVRNGIALSGTVHWMFDRGLLTLTDDLTILTSRHLNHDVSRLLVADRKALVPVAAHLRPHPHYLAWHRDSCFKA